MANMGKKLIAVCTTAIGIIYAAGYTVSQTQANVVDHTVLSEPLQQDIPDQRWKHEHHERPFYSASPANTMTKEPKVTTPSQTENAQELSAQKYKDGTYTGSGTNRFGTVEVAVTIKQGKIAAVEITDSQTRYPQEYIDSLPQAVIDAQSSDIETISGATRSSEDFINAVIEALNQSEQA